MKKYYSKCQSADKVITVLQASYEERRIMKNLSFALPRMFIYYNINTHISIYAVLNINKIMHIMSFTMSVIITSIFHVITILRLKQQ